MGRLAERLDHLLLDDEMRRWGTKRLQRGIGAAREATAL